MVRIIPCLLLSGCCCCWPFGGDDGGGFLEDYVEDRVAEEVSERFVEHALGAEDVEVGEDGSVTIRTADGTLQAREGDDGGVVITDGDGNVVLAGNDSASVPDDFPVAPYPGSTVTSSMMMDGGQMVSWQVDADFDDVLSHYRSQLEGTGPVQEGMDMATGDGRMVLFTSSDGSISVIATTEPGAPVDVAVTRVP